MNGNVQMNAAPGHIYDAKLGSGVEWQPGIARLWRDGSAIAEAPHGAASAREFFSTLAFVQCFPAITHWWFRSEWQGRVRISPPDGALGDGIYGYLQYDDEESPGLMWTMSDDTPVLIAAPMPTNAMEPANLPLRLALAGLALDVLTQAQPADIWLPVSSLTPATTLADALPAAHTALTRRLPLRLTALVVESDVAGRTNLVDRRYALDDAADLPMRDLLCWLQGIANGKESPE